MRLIGLEKVKKIYFIGIGGISMSALAKFLSVNGYEVSGSDEQRGEETENLAFYGVRFFVGVDRAREEIENADAVVYTDAIPTDHSELSFAKLLNKKLYSRAELLSIVCGSFPHVISVAGSHGKTTCTSMCAHVLKSASLPFTAHIGGEDAEFGNFYLSGREYFVTEACEYKKNLLKISSDVAVLLNIDKDHMECYDGEEDLIDCFRRYCESASSAFICADDKKCARLGDFPCFGIENPLADYRAVDLRAVGECYSFTVEEYGKALCRVRLKAIGRCNVYNALAAFSAARALGLSEKEIANGLESFRAVKRRFEKIGTYRGASLVCDYAHHPREICSTVRTAMGVCRGDLYVVFQPHTYSRTKLLLGEFISVLRPLKNLMIYKTYPAREKFDAEGSAEMLARAIGNCLYAENAYVLRTWMKKTVKEGDMVLFLGAGDIYYVAQYLLREL
ncbi:MAG: UDP-N-acetylmuramate--L-alanine ligase [Clostridiales bacterium]|nr:UDP-N-acetylmuramate--L-alanine ligase [Clostridiales bacterium]